MTRPDEIAALADELENFEEVVLRTDDGPEWSDKRSLSDDEKEMVVTALRLSATSPGDAVRALQSIAALSVEKGHTIASAQQIAKAALAPAEKAGDELKVACASCKKIPGPHCQRPTCAFREYIDTRAVKTILAMSPFELSIISEDVVEFGREMVRQAVAATPTPPSADDIAKISWLLTLAAEGLEFYRQERLRCGHKFGTKKVGLYDNEVDDFQSAKAVIQDFIQSAAHGSGTEGGEK